MASTFAGANVAAIPLGHLLPDTSSNQPGRQAEKAVQGCPHAPSLFGLAPGGVCPAASVASCAVRSYRTVSPLLGFGFRL